MKILGIFAAIISLAAVVLFNFAGMAAFFVSIILMIIGGAMYSRTFASGLGYVGARIGSNNNYHLALFAGITLLLFIFAIKYGAGEPILLDGWNKGSEIMEKNFTPEAQKKVNSWLYGRDNSFSSQEMAMLKSFLKSKTKEYPFKLKEEYANEKEYRERVANWDTFDIMINNEELSLVKQKFFSGTDTEIEGWKDNWLKNQQQVAKRHKKSWFLWKLAIFSLLMTIAYIPFAFADEAADLFEHLADKISKLRDEERLKGVTDPSSPEKPIKKDGTEKESKFGLISKLYSSDLAAEFTVKLLQNLSGFFRR